MTDIRLNKSVFGTNLSNYFSNDTVLFDTIHVNDGSKTAPSISFKNDTDTGFYRDLHGGVAKSIGYTIDGKFRFDVGATSSGRTYLELYKSNETSPIIQSTEGVSGVAITAIKDTTEIDKLIIKQSGSSSNLAIDFEGGDGIYKMGAHQLGFATENELQVEINNSYLGLNRVDIRGQDGSVSAPTYTFNNALTTGLYLSAPQTISVSGGGSELLRMYALHIEPQVPLYPLLGTVSLPSYSFHNDKNTGIYSSAADHIDFTTGGANRLDISTTNLTSKLPLRINYNAGNAQLSFQRAAGEYTNGTMFLDSANHFHISCTSGNGKIILTPHANGSVESSRFFHVLSGGIRSKQSHEVSSGVITNSNQASVIMERSGGNNAWGWAVQGGNNLGVNYFNGSSWSERGFVSTSGSGQINQTIQHRVSSKIKNPQIGMIVISTGKYDTWIPSAVKSKKDKDGITIDDALPIVEYSSKEKDPAVFGVISSVEETGKDKRTYQMGIWNFVFDKEEDDNRITINSGGEGAILVCNINGNLKNGDLICSSKIEGIGMKQDDDLLHSYTIAKITCDCDFNDKDFKIEPIENGKYLCALVGCLYMC